MRLPVRTRVVVVASPRPKAFDYATTRLQQDRGPNEMGFTDYYAQQQSTGPMCRNGSGVHGALARVL